VAVGITVTAVVATAAVAQATTSVARPPAKAAAKTSWSTTPKRVAGGWSFGTWQGHKILLPAQLTPPAGARVTTILGGRGVLVYTCTNGTFTLNGPQINLLSLAGMTNGLHFNVVNPAAPLIWASSVDGSRADMAIVTEIPTLTTVTQVLLKAVTTAGGPATTFGGTTFIVRLPIIGGVPAPTCTTPGLRIGVPFLTLYLVFKGHTTTTAAVAPAAAAPAAAMTPYVTP
jgi:hypothetical protein